MVIETNPVMIAYIVELVADFRKNLPPDLDRTAIRDRRFPRNVVIFKPTPLKSIVI
jgi:hypothetical protein